MTFNSDLRRISFFRREAETIEMSDQQGIRKLSLLLEERRIAVSTFKNRVWPRLVNRD
jgi:hypothetical protein